MDDGEWVSILRVSLYNPKRAGLADQIVNIVRRRDLYLPLCVLGFRERRTVVCGHFWVFLV